MNLWLFQYIPTCYTKNLYYPSWYKYPWVTGPSLHLQSHQHKSDWLSFDFNLPLWTIKCVSLVKMKMLENIYLLWTSVTVWHIIITPALHYALLNIEEEMSCWNRNSWAIVQHCYLTKEAVIEVIFSNLLLLINKSRWWTSECSWIASIKI